MKWQAVVLIVLLYAGFSIALALPTMWIWNGIIPAITGFAKITFWQAFLLNILGRFISGGGSSSSSK